MPGRGRPSASGDAAVSIGGDATAPVSTTYVGTQVLDRLAVPLQAAAKDPRAVFLAVGVEAFTGREWLVAGIDEFIAVNRCGYVFVEAEAGLGKTAFSAWLVKTRGYLSHFSRYAAGTSVAAALGNLSAQLITRFGMEAQAPGGMLPEWSRTPGGFEWLLAAAAGERQEPLVLVVDGLDEADAPEGGLPFGLPILLPDGVFVIATYRTGHSPRWPDAPAAVLRIARHDPRNRRDIYDYLAIESEEEVLAARLAEVGADPAEFASLLAERCGGVWVYLRYVLHELRIGLRRPDKVSGLPAGLRNYYAEQVRGWRQDPAWRVVTLPLLATLGVAGEALSAGSLARLAGDLDPATVQHWCNLELRPLLAAARAPSSGGYLQYEIYHASFRELLNGSLGDRPGQSDDQQPYELLALIDELSQATVSAHDRICDIYLSYFGGLDAGLPKLAADPDAAGTDGGYPRRHLVRHLRRAGRTADLHALLAASHLSGRDHAVNTWFAVHDHADSIVDYFADLAVARGESAAVTSRDLSCGQRAPLIGMEIRYALMAASIASVAHKIPVSLMSQLVNTGVWSPRRGLDHARRLVRPSDRVDALLAIHRSLHAEDQPAVVSEAMTAATAITDARFRTRALSSLMPYLPETDRPAVLVQALAAATAITDDQGQAEALAELAPHLPADLLAPALAAAAAIAESHNRARALTSLVPYLPETDRPAVLAQALAATPTITQDYYRALALSRLAPHLPEADRRAVLAQALAAATATQGSFRAGALAELAPNLSADLLAQALAIATATATAQHRALALAGLAPYLPEADRRTVLAQALAAATATQGIYRGMALVELAPHLPADLLAQALAAATATTQDHDRARTLAGLAPYLPEADRPAVLAEALSTAANADPEFGRADTLAKLAPHLPADLLAEALAAVTAITIADYRASALAGLAPYLPADLLAEALAATAITDHYDWAVALTGLAPYLPEADRPAVLAQALTVAANIANDFYRANTLTKLAPYLPEADQPAVLAQALTTAVSTSGANLVRLLTDLGPHLSADLLAEALAAAAADSHDFARAEALTRLAPYLPEADRPVVLAQALAAASTTVSYMRSYRLAELAPHLPADLLKQALAAATAITEDYHRASALISLAPYLPEADRPAVLAQALAATTATAENYNWVMALAELAPHLPADLLEQALAAATANIDDHYRAVALAKLAPYLPEADRPAVLAEALAAATAAQGYDQADALGHLAPQLPESDRPAVLAQALTAATATTSDLLRGGALRELIPQLPVDLLERALTATTAIAEDRRRASLLAELVPRLENRHLAAALQAAPRTDAQVLKALLKRAHTSGVQGWGLTYVELLRACTTDIDRKTCIDMLVSAVPAISEIGGIEAVTQCIHAVIDVYRWWP